MNPLDDIVGDFLAESRENLDQLDRDLVGLEACPESQELIGSIFRTIHTIKGTSGFLALHHLGALTHVGENLLSLLRDGGLKLSAERTTALLELADAVRALLVTLEATGNEGAPDHLALIGRLQQLAVIDQKAEATDPELEAMSRVGQLLVDAELVQPEDVGWALREQQMGDSRKLGAILVARGSVKQEHLEQALATQRKTRSSAAVRVDVDLLDSLLREVGELVLTRNQILSAAVQSGDPALQGAAQRLELIVGELQDGVIKTRLQPVETVWTKLPRIVRDLSLQCGKKVALRLEGRETGLDRTILDAIKDPLIHLVRNAIDHGIELPEARLAMGKPAEGVVLLRAFHDGGRVVVEIHDDGAGIDPQRVGARALELGLISHDQIGHMSDSEIQHLVLRPGFSTVASATSISGRGVGMDVVETNIQRIGGTVEINSVLGSGTMCRMTTPLTLTIMPALIVACGAYRYAIPQASLLEVIYSNSERGTSVVEYVHDEPVCRRRGQLLPLIDLAAMLEVSSTASELMGKPRQDTPAADTGGLHVVVLESEGRRFGLILDQVLDTEEIVVRALSQRLRGIGLYAGATILGDGAVALILDIKALFRRCYADGNAIVRPSAEANTAEADEDIESMLVVGVGGVGGIRRVALPLAMVTRLEQFPATSIERVGGREVVRYRDAIVPLVHLGSLLGGDDRDPGDAVLVVVYSEQGRSVALAVEEMIDIVTEKIHSRSDVGVHGLIGSAVIRDRVTELLDVREAVLAADPDFYHDLAEVG